MIRYVVGDATQPIGEGKKYILHCCNDKGAWGAGFVLAISKRWPGPEKAYRDLHESQRVLGNVQLIAVADDVWVANLIGQHGCGGPHDAGYPFIRYDAFLKGFKLLSRRALDECASIHMPRMGCGLAGGQWECVEKLLGQTFVTDGVEVVVYDQV